MADPLEPRRAPFRVTVQAALKSAVRSFKEHRVAVPELTAQLLLADVLERDKAWLYAHSDQALNPKQWDAYLDLVFSRCDGVPTQYVRGVQEFYGLEFRVTPDVLIPRPETEHLVEAALERLRSGDRVIDIGTGSGAIAIAVAKNAPHVSVSASDYSARAVGVARQNADSLSASVQFFVSDFDSAVRSRSIDVLLSNPPYVPKKDIGGLQRELCHEPSLALFAGEDGFDAYRQLVPGAARIVKPGGWLLLELGYNGREGIEQLLDTPKWRPPTFQQDLAGIDRVVSVRRRT